MTDHGHTPYLFTFVLQISTTKVQSTSRAMGLDTVWWLVLPWQPGCILFNYKYIHSSSVRAFSGMKSRVWSLPRITWALKSVFTNRHIAYVDTPTSSHWCWLKKNLWSLCVSVCVNAAQTLHLWRLTCFLGEGQFELWQRSDLIVGFGRCNSHPRQRFCLDICELIKSLWAQGFTLHLHNSPQVS